MSPGPKKQPLLATPRCFCRIFGLRPWAPPWTGKGNFSLTKIGETKKNIKCSSNILQIYRGLCETICETTFLSGKNGSFGFEHHETGFPCFLRWGCLPWVTGQKNRSMGSRGGRTCELLCSSSCRPANPETGSSCKWQCIPSSYLTVDLW